MIMLNAAAINSYQSTAVSTASGERLILLAYEGVIKFIKQAKKAIENGDTLSKVDKLSRSLGIIDELAVSLDMERGGEISERLAMLYDYIMRQIIKANVESSTEILDEILPLLNTLHEAWVEASDKSKTGPELVAMLP